MTILGLAAAPALDTDEPWFDYETWALSQRGLEVDGVRLGPLLRPAGLAARRPRAAAREGAAPRLLEGDQPRRLRRRALGARPQLDQPRRLRRLGLPRRGRRARGCSGSGSSVRNLRTQTFVTAGVACAIDSPRLSCAAARRRHLREREPRAAPRRRLRRARLHARAERARAPRGRARPTRPTLQRYTRIELPPALPPTPTRRPPPTRSATVVQFPLFGDPGAPLAQPAGRPGRATPRRRAALLARSALRAHLRARAAARARSRDAGGLRRRRCCATCAATSFAYTESPPPRGREPRRLPVRRRSRATASSSRARWRCCCAWAACPRACRPASRPGALRPQGGRVRRARPRRALVGRGLVPRHRLGDVRPDAGRRARALAGRRRGDGDAPRRAAGAPDLGGDIRSRPEPRRWRRPSGGTPWTLIAARRGARCSLLAGARRCGCCAATAAASPRAGARWPSSSARCARARRAPGPGRHAEHGRGGVRAHARRRGLRARAARAALRRPRRPRRRPSGRRAVRAELARGGGLAGRLRAWWALPPKPR